MNVYFTTSVKSALSNTSAILELIEHTKKLGHKVEVRPYSSKALEAKEATKEVAKILDLNVEDSFSRINKKIKNADVVIADTSLSSSSVGYEISMALSEKKPVLVLHDTSKLGSLADVVSGNKSKIIKVEKYKTSTEAKKAIEGFFDFAKDVIDTKFILIISPEIDKYLTWSADHRRQHKAQIVRNAVEDVMGKDKEYQSYLKEQY